MPRFSALLVGGLAFLGLECLTALPTTAQQGVPLHTGEWLIDGAANASRQHDQSSDETRSAFVVSPTGLVFATPHFALGASATLGYFTQTSGHSFSYGIGPRARYYLGGAATWLPFISGAVIPQWETTHQSASIGGATPDLTSRLLMLEGSLGVTRLVATHVGITGEAYYQHESLDVDLNATSSPTDRSYNFGLRFGLSVFVH